MDYDCISFDDTDPNHYDVCLHVDTEKFYVLKGFLASHSEYFNNLFFGKYSDRDETQFTIENTKADAFRKFLETLNGLLCLDDDCVEDVLRLSILLKAPVATKRAEDFLIHESEMEVKKMYNLAVEFLLPEVKLKAIKSIKTSDELRSILPQNLYLANQTSLQLFLDKSMEILDKEEQNRPPPLPAPAPDIFQWIRDNEGNVQGQEFIEQIMRFAERRRNLDNI